MRSIVFHGVLREKFGRAFKLDVSSVSEGVRALCMQIRGLRQHLQVGHYHVVWIKPDGTKMNLPVAMLKMRLGKGGNIHILPALAGAAFGSAGMWELIAGAAIIAAAFIFSPALPMLAAGSTDLGMVFGGAMGASAISLGGLGSISYGAIAALGFGLAIFGAGQLLAPSRWSTDDQASSFALPQNTTQQGISVPAFFGTFLVGSIVISTAIVNASVPIGVNFGELTQVSPGKGGYSASTNQSVPVNNKATVR